MSVPVYTAALEFLIIVGSRNLAHFDEVRKAWTAIGKQRRHTDL